VFLNFVFWLAIGGVFISERLMELYVKKSLVALVPHAGFRVGLVVCAGKKASGRNGMVFSSGKLGVVQAAWFWKM
jgi:hypothetical protein